MIKGQIHEEFKSFSAPTFEKTATQAEIFSASVAAKSLAALLIGGNYYISLGYRTDEPAYPVSIERMPLEHPEVMALDDQMEDAIEHANGEIICHAFFFGPEVATPFLALMLHG